jgi:hypothetical protein
MSALRDTPPVDTTATAAALQGYVRELGVLPDDDSECARVSLIADLLHGARRPLDIAARVLALHRGERPPVDPGPQR